MPAKKKTDLFIKPFEDEKVGKLIQKDPFTGEIKDKNGHSKRKKMIRKDPFVSNTISKRSNASKESSRKACKSDSL